MSIAEVMVVIALGLALIVIAVPTVSSLFMLEQRGAARQLAIGYEQLHDEAMMRNISIRIAYHIYDNKYVIEAGPPDALIFDNAEAREEWSEVYADRLESMDEEKRAAILSKQPFQKFNAKFKTEFSLPRKAIFKGVYTPQYGEMVMREEEPGEEAVKIVYSYIFPNGFMEHTVVQIVDPGDLEDGFTVEVEPLAGKVTLHPTLIDWEDSFEFVPDEGPELSL